MQGGGLLAGPSRGCHWMAVWKQSHFRVCLGKEKAVFVDRAESIWQTESCDLSLAIGRTRKTLRICVVGKAEGKPPQTLQMEREMCISTVFQIMGCHCTIMHLCFLKNHDWLFSARDFLDTNAHLLCPTFTFPNHHWLGSKHELLQQFKMSPLFLPEAILAQHKPQTQLQPSGWN